MKMLKWLYMLSFYSALTVFIGSCIKLNSFKNMKYEPTWKSLDSRPLPPWFDEAKIGIFIHWGVYSVPSFAPDSLNAEWFWFYWKSNVEEVELFMKNNYPPNFTYQNFASDFTAEFFEPEKWARLFKLSGAKYVVLTSKHHEGYTLWPSKYSFSWNSKDIGPNRDLVGELSDAISKKTDLKFGLYYSLFEWFNPLYLEDKASNFTQTKFVEGKIIPELKELINTYKPSILWADGEWVASDIYWKSKEFLAWLYNESPVKNTVIVNDRWDANKRCKHGDFYTCKDKFKPGKLLKHKWENCVTLDLSSWGYRRNANYGQYMSIQELLRTLIETISIGGNLLINIGPTKEGTIIPIFQERLIQMGIWLKINGEAIYSSVPWKYQNDTEADVWYTSKQNAVYAIFLTWPDNNVLVLTEVKKIFNSASVTVTFLGHKKMGDLKWSINHDKVHISLPYISKKIIHWAWVLKINI